MRLDAEGTPVPSVDIPQNPPETLLPADLLMQDPNEILTRRRPPRTAAQRIARGGTPSAPATQQQPGIGLDQLNAAMSAAMAARQQHAERLSSGQDSAAAQPSSTPFPNPPQPARLPHPTPVNLSSGSSAGRAGLQTPQSSARLLEELRASREQYHQEHPALMEAARSRYRQYHDRQAMSPSLRGEQGGSEQELSRIERLMAERGIGSGAAADGRPRGARRPSERRVGVDAGRDPTTALRDAVGELQARMNDLERLFGPSSPGQQEAMMALDNPDGSGHGRRRQRRPSDTGGAREQQPSANAAQPATPVPRQQQQAPVISADLFSSAMSSAMSALAASSAPQQVRVRFAHNIRGSQFDPRMEGQHWLAVLTVVNSLVYLQRSYL